MLTGVLLRWYNLMYYSSCYITMDCFAQDSTATRSLGHFAASNILTSAVCKTSITPTASCAQQNIDGRQFYS
jgi:hypothetical protein